MPRRNVTTASQCNTGASPTDFLDEDLVLKPITPGEDSDDWPCFVLEDAIVYSKDQNHPANLLHAELEGPFSIRGTLRVGRNEKSLQILPGTKHQIQLSKVVGFSLGEPATLWASGRAGWFELRPAIGYQKIYNDMEEAIALYFFMVDTYTDNNALKATGRRKKMTMQAIYKEYLAHLEKQNLPIITEFEMHELLFKHASFLISQFRRSDNYVKWPRTLLFEWIVDMCPKVYQSFIDKDNSASENTNGKRVSSVDKASKAAKTATKSLTTASDLREKASNPSIAEVIHGIMVELYGSATSSRQTLTLPYLCKLLVQRFELENESTAKELISLNAKSIVGLLSKDWQSSSIYRKLQELVIQPYVSKTSTQKLGRTFQLVLRDSQPVTSNRPTETKVSQKVALAKENPIGVKEELETEEKILVDGLDDTTSKLRNSRSRKYAGKGAGKNATLRTPAGKRALDADVPEPTDGHPSTKRPKRSYTPSSTDDSEEEEDDEYDIKPIDDNGIEQPEPYLDANYFDEIEPRTMELELHTEATPSIKPTGPNGLWACQREGCGFEVPAANRHKGREAVNKHIWDHANAQERILMTVEAEGKNTCHSVTNLLARIRALGEQARVKEQDERKVIDNRIVPLPIKRKLMS